MMFSPMIGGALAAIELRTAFFVDSLSFIVSAMCLLFIRLAPEMDCSDSYEQQSIGRGIRQGFDYLRRDKSLQWLFGLSVPVMLSYGVYNALEVVFAQQIVKTSDFEFSLMLVAGGLGLAAGSWGVGVVNTRLQPEQAFALGILSAGLMLSALSSLSSLPPVLFCNVIDGIGNALFLIGSQTILQSRVPATFLGRVFALRSMINNAVLICAMALAGILAGIVGVRFVLLVSGLITLLAMFMAIFLRREMFTTSRFQKHEELVA